MHAVVTASDGVAGGTPYSQHARERLVQQKQITQRREQWISTKTNTTSVNRLDKTGSGGQCETPRAGKGSDNDTYTTTGFTQPGSHRRDNKISGNIAIKTCVQYVVEKRKTMLTTVCGSKNEKDHLISGTQIHTAPTSPVLR